jgi:hypothetical protein
VKADPMQIIDLVPEDIRPYVIFNLALSVSEPGAGPYGIHVTTPTIAESWLRACAERGVWAVIQPASGRKCNLPDAHTPNDVYEHFFQAYPNFLGYNFAEQCWGFATAAEEEQRLALFSDLLPLAARYGGYLFVSHTQTMNAPQLNALAFLKRSPDFRYAAKRYRDHYITMEKYTTGRGFYDVESTSLGAYLSGYCGNYGMRFDNCGWTYVESRKNIPFPEALGGMLMAEHFLLTGATVQDGPELTWEMAIVSDGTHTSADGYRSKRFKAAAGFLHHNVDLFRKQIDGSFPIPSKDEVMARTQVALVNDVPTGSPTERYATPPSLFTGLYAVDGEHSNNRMWTKSSGRYPSLPTIFQPGSYETEGFKKIIKMSDYAVIWPTVNAKVAAMDVLFPEAYAGTIFAGRMKNTWMTYNPYMGVYVNNTTYEMKHSPASGMLPFRYNTCTEMEVVHSNYGYAVIREWADRVDVYVNNYCSAPSSPDVPLLRTTELKIYGSTQRPTYTYRYRGNAGADVPSMDVEQTTIADFETNHVGDTYPMTGGNGQCEVVRDPSGTSNVLHIFGPANMAYPTLPIALPAGTRLGDYQTLRFDFNGGNNSGRYGQGLRMAINHHPLTGFESAAAFGCPDGAWGRGLIALPLADLPLSEAEKELTAFTLTLGSATGAGNYYIDNVVLERAVEVRPVTEAWSEGVFTLSVRHNAPLDLTIHCAGTATDRSTDYPPAPVVLEPPAPPIYYGPRQHEFEDFAYQNIESIQASHPTDELENYTGLGYSIFGSHAGACMRKEVEVPESGGYLLQTRYSAPVAAVETVELWVNHQPAVPLLLPPTAGTSDWQTVATPITLHQGKNTVEWKATGASAPLYLDHIVIEKADGTGVPPFDPPTKENRRVLSEEYFSVLGQRIHPARGKAPSGIYILRSRLSDGSTQIRKISSK